MTYLHKLARRLATLPLRRLVPASRLRARYAPCLTASSFSSGSRGFVDPAIASHVDPHTDTHALHGLCFRPGAAGPGSTAGDRGPIQPVSVVVWTPAATLTRATLTPMSLRFRRSNPPISEKGSLS